VTSPYNVKPIVDLNVSLWTLATSAGRPAVSMTCAIPRLSMLAAQGASLLEIADVLGHKTLTMVTRYSHLVVEHKAKVTEKMVAAKGL
jgi:integrase